MTLRAKSTIRAEVRRLIAGLSAAARAERSRAVIVRLTGLIEEARPSAVMAYLAMADEPDVDGLIVARAGAGLPTLAPDVEWDAGLLRPRLVEVEGPDRALDDGRDAHPTGASATIRCRLGRHGVRAPLGPARALTGGAWVLVPGVAFDASGGRLGRGAGFYDRFLDSADGLIAVGVGFDEQIVPILPMEPHDRPMDLIVTPTRTIRPQPRADTAR